MCYWIAKTITFKSHVRNIKADDRVLQMVTKLAEFSRRGARAVVLFLSPSHTRQLVTALQRAEQQGALQPHQLVLLSATGWGDNTDLVSYIWYSLCTIYC